jgi:hypothetical protein
MSDDTLRKPEGLSAAGEKAYDIIMKRLKETGLTNTGGCRAFYSPREWIARGELYGEDGVLIVVYDGGDLKYHFNGDAGEEIGWEIPEATADALEKGGFYYEECTCWYSVIIEG